MRSAAFSECVFKCVPIGKSPAQQFTAVIHTVTPLQSQISPVVKLIIAVAKSKFCAQVGRAVMDKWDLILLLITKPRNVALKKCFV